MGPSKIENNQLNDSNDKTYMNTALELLSQILNFKVCTLILLESSGKVHSSNTFSHSFLNLSLYKLIFVDSNF